MVLHIRTVVILGREVMTGKEHEVSGVLVMFYLLIWELVTQVFILWKLMEPFT